MVATKSEDSSSTSSLSSTLSTSLNPKDSIGSESTEISTGNSGRRNSGGNSKVRVGVRVRPLTCQEVGQDGKSVVVVNPPEIRLGERRFNYDKVFGENVGQEELYGSISSPLLQSFLDGYNATIMAYGQTGSGKTFTMGSEAHTELGVDESTGIIPRFMNDLFDQLDRRKQAGILALESPGDGSNKDSSNNSELVLKEYQIQATFLEVYGEDVHDLLNPERPTLPVREDGSGGTVCSGLTHRAVESASQALAVLHTGTLHRTTAATLMNLTSSRSHAVFSIILNQIHHRRQSDGPSAKECDKSNTVPVMTTSKFNFVDLAGSERMKKTGAQGERAKEGIKINEGLLALGNVINALADQEKKNDKKIHVPYRQSKLTRLLQDALGGNSQTLFLACVSPSDINASETLSTLHYANRARNIQNVVSKNIDSTGNLANMLQVQMRLTTILQAELVKSKFAHKVTTINSGGENKEKDEEKEETDSIGVVDDALMNRPDVLSYLDRLQNTAKEKTLSMSQPPLQSMPKSSKILPQAYSNISPLRQISSASSALATTVGGIAGSPIKSNILDYTMDHTLLDEVNPEEEMAILDQLLELQQDTQNYEIEQKEGHAQLKEVEGELAEKEGLLLQLRDSLKVYHNMKEKYEVLMSELQQLELEKAKLAEQLEKATVDPSQGCSAAIKKKLEKVENTLIRARIETRKHREKYLKAEQEAQKCRVLEQKITTLKAGRVTLMKKEREAATRYRENTEKKQREIMALKRKGRNVEKKVSKLQIENTTFKRNLEKRQADSKKLSEKLKQTESHLMKLLAMRQRNLRDRGSVVGASRRRTAQSILAAPAVLDDGVASSSSDEVKSILFLLGNIVTNKIHYAEVQCKYEEAVADYGEKMRRMVESVRNLEKARDNPEACEGVNAKDTVRDLEQTVEEQELKTELVAAEVEKLRTQLCMIDEKNKEEEKNPVVSLIEDKRAPVIRTLMLELIDKYVVSEQHRMRLTSKLERKESILQSFENEIEILNNRIKTLSMISNHHPVGANVTVEVVETLAQDKASLTDRLSVAQGEISRLKGQIRELLRQQKRLESESAEAKEKLALQDAISKQDNGEHSAECVLKNMQAIWRELGVSSTSRDKVRKAIENCLEDTCDRVFGEASQLKKDTEIEINTLKCQKDSMHAALGISDKNDAGGETLFEQLDNLRSSILQLKPTFQSAVTRRGDNTKQVNSLMAALESCKESLHVDLQMLLESRSIPEKAELEGASFDPKTLSDEFLCRCEREITELRIKKSEVLVQNTELQKNCFSLLTDMNLTGDDVIPLVVHSVTQRLDAFPDWWNKESSEDVVRAITVSTGLVRPAKSFSDHLAIIHESLTSVSKSRRLLSTSLRAIVEKAQKALLETVNGEVDAREAYASFHEALFRLPSLSKELIHACIAEIDALVSGVDTMSQSEIEALTVVWETLNVSISNRGKFWGAIEESVTNMKAKPSNPFDEVIRSSSVDGEQWVLLAAKNATKTCRELEIRLYKLDQIHQEVEKLRSRQDAMSRILSLDSELLNLNTKLSEFEDKKCNKQRLLTKKVASSTLLKQERFRKQMQGRFTTKLEQLANLLRVWKEDEGATFDPKLLSDDVRILLRSSGKIDAWVEQRTELMHLRTVKSDRTPGKRVIGAIGRTLSELTPPRKRAFVSNSYSSRREDMPTKKSRDTKNAGKPRTKRSRASPQNVGKQRAARTRSETKRATLEDNEEMIKKSPKRKPPLSVARKRFREESSAQRLPLSPVLGPQKADKKIGKGDKRLTLPPFGHVLEQALTPAKGGQENKTDIQ